MIIVTLGAVATVDQGRITPPPEMTCGFLIQLVFCKKKTMWFIGVEVEQETSAPPPEKNPGSAPVDVIKANNNDANLVNNRTVHFARLFNRRLVLTE